MATQPNLVVAPTIPNVPIMDPGTGQTSWTWLKWFQNMQQAVNAGLSIIGQFIGELSPTVKISGRGGTVGSITQHIDDVGVLLGPGVDFARSYVNKTTDFIADGVGSPLAGGKVAFQSLIASGPIVGKSLVYNGAAWVPQNVNYSNVTGAPILPNSQAFATSRWLNSYNAASGNFATSQPNFTDVAGRLAVAQLPALGLTHTVTLAH